MSKRLSLPAFGASSVTPAKPASCSQVDAEAWALRFIPREAAATADHLGDVGEAVEFPDVRGVDDALGESVSVDSACGTPANTCATI